jgi:hypothetical protein
MSLLRLTSRRAMVTFDAAADAVVSAALDEVQFPQPTASDLANGFDMHDETGMTVQ